MTIALWILGLLATVAFLFAGGSKLILPRERLIGMGMRYVEDFRTWQIKLIGVAELLGAAGIVVGIVLSDSLIITLWLTFAAALALVILMVGAIVTHLRRKELAVPPAIPGALAAATAVLSILVVTSWPGGVPAPSVPIPANPIWTGTTKPSPVPEGNVVLSMPKDMYRHNGAPTEWWWHIGTLRAGDRTFGFEINAASFVGQGFGMTQISLSDVDGGNHYDHTQLYAIKPVGGFDVSTWAEGDPGRDWYARIGDAAQPVGGLVVTDGGSGYTSAPEVRFEGGGGSGAAAFAVLDGDQVGTIVLNSPGSGYTSAPTVTLVGGGGSGATTTAVRNAVLMTAPQSDPTQYIHVEAVVTDEETLTEVEYDLTFSQQGRPFYEFGTGVNPSSTIQSLGEDNYYFSFTRLAASGTITVDGTPYEVSGTTWMDHEYGNFGGGGDGHIRWLLSDLQLDNGMTITTPGLIDAGYKPEIGVSVPAQVTVQELDGSTYYVAGTITPTGALWTSPRSGQSYAQQFRIQIPSFGADLTVKTRLQDQEFVVSGAPVYEGTADVSGTLLDEKVSGDAWMEQAF